MTDTTLPSKADVVVIGGGISGSSVAFHVARTGGTSVVLLERGELGCDETAASAGMLVQQTGSPELSRLAKMSMDEYRRFEDEVGLRITGSVVYTCDKLGLPSLRDQARTQTDIGIPSKILLDPTDIEALYRLPDIGGNRTFFVSASDIVAAVHVASDGFLDTHATVEFFSKGAREAGARMFVNTEATSIARGIDGEVKAIRTSRGEIETQWVVNAAGAFAHHVGRFVGLDLPVGVNTRDMFLLNPPIHSDNFPILEDASEGWYLRSDYGRILAASGPVRKETWFGGVTGISNHGRLSRHEEAIEPMTRWLRKRAPPLADSSLLDQWAGVRSMSRDGLPILGPVMRVPGYLNCCGWSGSGVTCAAGAGKLIAELICSGQTKSLSIEPFVMSRTTLARIIH